MLNFIIALYTMKTIRLQMDNVSMHQFSYIPYSIKLWWDKSLMDLELQENQWRKFWWLITLMKNSSLFKLAIFGR